MTDDPASDANRDGRSNAVRGVARWLAFSSPLAVPWVVVWTTSATLVFPWGMVSVEGWHLTTLPGYLGATAGLPRYLEMWGWGALCYLLALGWAAAEPIGADQRVTAGLLALGALAAAWMAMGLGTDPHTAAIPIGSIHLLVLAAWALRRA